ncbi:MAG: fibronectin type III domain-containing protein, partial [Euryarchaeota archaeon]|nr:fibronectin type III domain-containing protein [Euryarchaeota archaeon]
GLKLATFDDAWTTQWVVKSDSYDQGVWNSLNVDTAGQPQIAYSGPDGESLVFAAWHGSLWLTSEVFSLPVEGEVSSAVDRVGSVHIAYYDDDESVFRFISQITAPGQSTMSLVLSEDSVLIGIGSPAMDGGASIDQYIVYRGTSVDNLVPIATLMASINLFNDTHVDSDTTYYYAIKAVNSEGAGEMSSIQSITTEAGDEANDVDLTLLVIVAVIVVAVIVGAFIFLNRRKR